MSAMKNEVVTVSGTNWLVREAVSLEAAASAIAMARCNGSVGSRETAITGGFDLTVIADVVKLHPDGHECLPYGAKGEDYSALVAAAGAL